MKEETKKLLEEMSIFDPPETIDELMKTKIHKFSNSKEGKKTPGARKANYKNAWNEKELELRRGIILDYLTKQHCSCEETARQISARWEISMDTARKYVSEAKHWFTTLCAEEQRDELRARYQEMIQSVIQTSEEEGKKELVLKGIDMLNKMGGFYQERSKLEIEGNVEIKFDFS